MKLLGRSFMCIKDTQKPKTGPCSTPTLISLQWEFWPLIKTLWYLLSKKNFKNVSVSYQKHLIVFNLYIKLSCQTLSKPFDIPKIRGASFQRRKIMKQFINSVHHSDWSLLTHESVFLNRNWLEHNKLFS